MATFASLGVSPWLVDACRRLGLRVPTPVQRACIPQILAGKDAIGAAETGTGKTAAFVLPILQTLGADPYGVCAVVLTPTRELAFQISQQVRALGASIGVRDLVVVGGVHEVTQAMALEKRPHVVVATPGRLAALVRDHGAELGRVRFVVLDEADRLLHPTYTADLTAVLGACDSEKRQTLMFSATMTSSIEELQSVAMGENAFRFDARENRFATVEALRQEYLFVPDNLKECYLVHLLKVQYAKESIIIFVGRCETAELLVTMLNLLGMKKVAALHSEMKQTSRVEALQKFKGKTVRALIATDVASRGLDIPACEIVLNYDLPRKTATYVHRVGRTARAGRGGLALSFVAQTDVDLVHAIEEKIEHKLEQHECAPEKTVMEQLSNSLKARQIAKMNLSDNGFTERVETRRADARGAAKKRKREFRASAKASKLSKAQAPHPSPLASEP